MRHEFVANAKRNGSATTKRTKTTNAQAKLIKQRVRKLRRITKLANAVAKATKAS